MNKKMTTILCGSAVGAALLLAAPTASADAGNSATCGSSSCNGWGQEVKTANTVTGYGQYPSRGAYVATQANPNVDTPTNNPNSWDPNLGPGYGAEIHNLARGHQGPGNSDPSNKNFGP
jgi:hypothetical protein